MIEVRHLTRRFANVLAVDDLSFRLESGEVVGFLGPNGAGKTTTLRMLTGYLPATSAERLEVAGHDVLRESLEVRRRIGYLPESVPLYRELRVREMMLFQGRLHGLSRGELRQRVPEVLDRVGVLDRERQLVGKLSRGLRQRVGLAVALLPRPEVLILDEPTSGLDPIQRREVRQLIRDLADEHTVLLSSHILAEVESVAPRVIILHEGRLLADGRPDELVGSIGGPGHVRFEAVVGDAGEAARLLLSLPGVEDVRELGRIGIHESFAVHGQGDLREDVGALAMTRGWAVRELSWARPSLEEIFARLVLGGAEASLARPSGSEPGTPAPAPAPPAAQAPAFSTGLQLAPDTPALGTPGKKKVIYSLNPFDQGAGRDLGKPMALDDEPLLPPTSLGGEPAPPEDPDA